MGEQKFKSCCFTGYRPQKFHFPFKNGEPEYTALENKLIDAVAELTADGCYTFYTGMAMGFDIAAAETVLLLRELTRNASVELISVVPFIEQSSKFDSNWLSRYNRVLGAADEVILTSDTYYAGCYQRRNEFMVDNSDYVLTWFDGKPGGTRNTLYYADKRGKSIINLYSDQSFDYSASDDYLIED